MIVAPRESAHMVRTTARYLPSIAAPTRVSPMPCRYSGWHRLWCVAPELSLITASLFRDTRRSVWGQRHRTISGDPPREPAHQRRRLTLVAGGYVLLSFGTRERRYAQSDHSKHGGSRQRIDHVPPPPEVPAANLPGTGPGFSDNSKPVEMRGRKATRLPQETPSCHASRATEEEQCICFAIQAIVLSA